MPEGGERRLEPISLSWKGRKRAQHRMLPPSRFLVTPWSGCSSVSGQRQSALLEGNKSWKPIYCCRVSVPWGLYGTFLPFCIMSQVQNHRQLIMNWNPRSYKIKYFFLMHPLSQVFHYNGRIQTNTLTDGCLAISFKLKYFFQDRGSLRLRK